MGPPLTTPTLAKRLKREEHRWTNHDSSFSKWKILIGPTDWEDHLSGKEGTERYRVHNLPSRSSPGVYEIGVAVVPVNGSCRDAAGRLEPKRIVVVYLGQAESVRSRLQSYGRGGSHLEKKVVKNKRNNNYNHYYYNAVQYSSSLSSLVDAAESSPRLDGGFFVEIFARGYPIVYRWAPMNSKSDAERVECQLLATFDYPWNKVSNGLRRPADVLLKIDKISSSKTTSIIGTPKILKIVNGLTRRRVGIPIKSVSDTWPDGDSHIDNAAPSGKSRNLLARVIKFSRFQPKIVESEPTTTSVNAGDNICGVRLDDGSVCMKQPVKGRKRCFVHKGKKKYSSRTKSESPTGQLIPDRKTSDYVDLPGCDSGEENKSLGKTTSLSVSDLSGCDSESNLINLQKITLSNDSCLSNDGEKNNFSQICGFTSCDGSPCTLKPASGRKRCEDHKGRRIQQTPATSMRTSYGKVEALCSPSDDNIVSSGGCGCVDNEGHYFSQICGVILCDGSPCTLEPASGRKRCKEHKGRRIR